MGSLLWYIRVRDSVEMKMLYTLKVSLDSISQKSNAFLHEISAVLISITQKCVHGENFDVYIWYSGNRYYSTLVTYIYHLNIGCYYNIKLNSLFFLVQRTACRMAGQM